MGSRMVGVTEKNDANLAEENLNRQALNLRTVKN